MAAINKQLEYFSGWICMYTDAANETFIKLFKNKPSWNSVFGYLDMEKPAPYGQADETFWPDEFQRFTGIDPESIFPRPKNRKEWEERQKKLFRISITVVTKVDVEGEQSGQSL